MIIEIKIRTINSQPDWRGECGVIYDEFATILASKFSGKEKMIFILSSSGKYGWTYTSLDDIFL